MLINVTSIETPLPETISDADLLDGWASDHHSQALATLVDRYSRMVLSVCRRRCRCANDAEDAYQTTFLYLADNAAKIKRPECLPGWLQRVAQRAAIATLHAHARHTEPMVEVPAKPDDPLMRLTQRHEAIVLDEELAAIPEHYRAALVLHIFDELPLAELADHFGTTIGSIRGRLQRGKQMLARRLRRRGIAPVVALAAGSAWTVSTASANELSEQFISSATDGDLPESPIDHTTLDALLSQGTRLMFSVYTTAGVLGGSALLALVIAINAKEPPMGPDSSDTVTMQSVPAAVDHLAAHADPELVVAQATNSKKNQNKNRSSNTDDEKQTTTQKENNATNRTEISQQRRSTPANQVWINQLVLPKATSATARLAEKALDTDIQISIPESKIKDLAAQLTTAVGVPFTIDQRAIAFAEVDPEAVQPSISIKQAPLRTALRQLLRPRGLRVVVEDHGFVITADPAVLVHQGIGTSRWINLDDEFEKKIAVQLQEKGSVEFIETPLQEAIASLSHQFDVPMRIDRAALEEHGMTLDEPVTAGLNDAKLQSTLKSVLTSLELTYAVQDEALVITSVDRAESRLLNRIYWLESAGFASGDFDSVMNLLQCSIEPDAWEAIGGPSTMMALPTSRPAILVSTTYTIHQDLERFFKTVRQSHFGDDPVIEPTQVPASQVPSGMQFGGGGFGGGGFGGGGGFM